VTGASRASLAACLLFLQAVLAAAGCSGARRDATAAADPRVDAALASFIGTIRAVDNHTHVNSVDPNDSESDALPLDVLAPFELPATVRPENRAWAQAAKALYGYQYDDLSEAHVAELRAAVQRTAREQGDHFPAWVLDRVGTETMLANRVAMGPGLGPPRFAWVSFADALMLPLSTRAEGAVTP